MKSVILDFKILNKSNITPEEFLFLYYISDVDNEYNNRLNCVINIKELEAKRFIKINPDDSSIELRQLAIDLIDFLTVEIENDGEVSKKVVKKSSRAINQELENNVVLFRDKWKGLKAGSMGSLKACKDKLYRWMKENPEYSMDQILKAADTYLNTFTNNYDFLQRADYFIFKQENHKEESSRLSAFIDEIDNSNNDDWTTSLN